MKPFLFVVAFLATFLALGCPPAPVTPSPGDGGATDAKAVLPDAGAPDAPPAPVFDPGTGCTSMCSRLAAAGCPEGLSATCLPVCIQDATSHVNGFDPLGACIAAATTPAAFRACKIVRCVIPDAGAGEGGAP